MIGSQETVDRLKFRRQCLELAIIMIKCHQTFGKEIYKAEADFYKQMAVLLA